MFHDIIITQNIINIVDTHYAGFYPEHNKLEPGALKACLNVFGYSELFRMVSTRKTPLQCRFHVFLVYALNVLYYPGFGEGDVC